MRSMAFVTRSLGGLALVSLLMAPLTASAFTVTFGNSFDPTPTLQEILDSEYGPGAINVTTDYEGYLAGDADPGFWEDFQAGAVLIREIAGFSDRNTMGWYQEDLTAPPVIDGVDDGVIFVGPASAGTSVTVTFPSGVTRFGLYLNPNGDLDSGTYAPEPELFFTNRFYNDIGPDGSGALHEPFDGDVQCLIFNITALRNGVPTYVVAWEDLDYGAPIGTAYSPSVTDNDYNDLVVEIQAESPVTVVPSSFGEIKALYEN